jgi:hypothetical protein
VRYDRVKKYRGVFAKNAAPHVTSRMILDHFVPSIQVVILQMLVLQVVVLNCTSKTSYDTKSVYSSRGKGDKSRQVQADGPA